MQIDIQWHPCDANHMPDDGRLVLFQCRGGEGEMLRWEDGAKWARWNDADLRWCYVDELQIQ